MNPRQRNVCFYTASSIRAPQTARPKLTRPEASVVSWLHFSDLRFDVIETERDPQSVELDVCNYIYLFYSILFYSILFCSILFYSILFYLSIYLSIYLYIYIYIYTHTHATRLVHSTQNRVNSGFAVS